MHLIHFIEQGWPSHCLKVTNIFHIQYGAFEKMLELKKKKPGSEDDPQIQVHNLILGEKYPNFLANPNSANQEFENIWYI